MTSRISYLNPQANRVLVVSNPRAGSGGRQRAVSDLVDCLESRGLKTQLVSHLDRLAPATTRYHAEGELRAVVAAGGDGTIAEIVNRTTAQVPVTIYPLGTANLLASYFQFTPDPVSLAQTILEGATVRLDAGKANGRTFLLMAGCGFDADVVNRLHRLRSGRNISYWTYAKPIWDAVRSYKYPDLRVFCANASDGSETTLRGRWAFVVNLPCYAAGLQLAPEACGSDGRLEVCTFGHGSLWHGLRYLGYVMLRRHRVLPDCQTATATRLRIESDESVSYQLDGDPGGVLPLDIEVMTERWTLLAPRSGILARGFDAAFESPAGAS